MAQALSVAGLFPMGRPFLGPGASMSRHVRDGGPQPPAAPEAVPHDLHSGQRGVFIPPQPRLQSPDLNVHTAPAQRHPSLGFPPVDPFKPADRLCPDGPFAAAPNDGRRPAIRSTPHHHMFHARRLWRRSDISDVRTMKPTSPTTTKPRLPRRIGLEDGVFSVGPTGIEPMTSTV